MNSTSADFLDVPALIERSEPGQRGGWMGYVLGVVLLLALTSAYISRQSPAHKSAVDVLSKVVTLGLLAGMGLLMPRVVRRQREEMRRLEALEELVQLRRWPEAAGMARDVLSQPARTPQARVQALIYLSSILSRYQRFEEAISVHNHLLETVLFDESTAHGIRLGRAMAMLREDHLVDADGAISELRRMAQGRDSAGLALVELYRDVKTGHPVEAIERFDKSLPVFRQQLGQRTGDAYALLARAHDLLGETDAARAAYEKATLLTNVLELNRRYPEVAKLDGKYGAALMPQHGPEAA
ncbi:MAG: tetratricopeptide repeat protein [Tepidisphaeraceae bacterium]